MNRSLLISFFLCLGITISRSAPVAQAVMQDPQTKNIKSGSLNLPTGATLTINLGANIVNNGSATGFGGVDANGQLSSLGLTSTGKTNAGLNKDVWISIRTDGKAGSGTKSDPFDASGSATNTIKFDTLMAGLGTNIIIHLLPGTFWTLGSDGAYTPLAGQKIYGSGQGVTTVKLGINFNPAANKHSHFRSIASNVDGVEIHDLTCDANYAAMTPGVGANQHDAWGGIRIYGNNCTIENVELINCYGDVTNNLEQFSILAGGLDSSHHCSNIRIINCWTHQYAAGANYTNGPDIAYGTNGLIFGCSDDGSNHGYGFTDWVGGRIMNCSSTTNTQKPFYTDTLSISDIVISHNIFYATLMPIQFNSGGAANNITIDSNHFYSIINPSPAFQQNTAIYAVGSGGGTNWIITNNTFVNTANQAGSGLITNQGNFVTGIYIAGNTVNSIRGADGASNIYNSNNLVGPNIQAGIPKGVQSAENKAVMFSKSMTVTATNDTSTLNINTGGTLGSNAFTSTAYEPTLGNPASNGSILGSTTGGTRSWIPAHFDGSGNPQVFDSNSSMWRTMTAPNGILTIQ